MKKPAKRSKVQQAKLRAEEEARLDRLLDTIPLRTLVRAARGIIKLSPALQGFTVQRTAHEQRLIDLESGAATTDGDMFSAEVLNGAR